MQDEVLVEMFLVSEFLRYVISRLRAEKLRSAVAAFDKGMVRCNLSKMCSSLITGASFLFFVVYMIVEMAVTVLREESTSGT